MSVEVDSLKNNMYISIHKVAIINDLFQKI